MRRAWRRRSFRITTISALVAALVAAMVGVGLGVAQAEEGDIEHVTNGTFDTTSDPWWNYGGTNFGAPAGQLCMDLAAAPGGNPWDAGIGLDGLALANGAQYTFSFVASASAPATVKAVLEVTGTGAQPLNQTINLTPTPQTFTFTSPWTSDNVAKIVFQVGGNADAYTFCADNVSVFGPATAPPPPPAPEPNSELVTNGTFDTAVAPWVSYGGTAPAEVRDGRLCMDLAARTQRGNTYDAAIQLNNLTLVEGFRYHLTFTASSTAPVVVRTVVGRAVSPFETFMDLPTQLVPANTPITFSSVFTNFPVLTTMSDGQIAFQIGGLLPGFTFCLDDVSLKANVAPIIYQPETGPRVRVNQVAYLPNGPKNATLVTEATSPRLWKLRNSAGKVVALGLTRPRGVDISSGQNTHSIDFSRYRKSGTGFTLAVDGDTSRPFDIGRSAYDKLQLDAAKFYYTQRSGIAILDSLRPGYGRAAGHLQVPPNQGDTSVPCFQNACDYSLDVRGGWYDAGDHGKYVVNGGISVFQLMSAYERAVALGRRSAVTKDGNLAIPESGNRVPDILDEAKWEMSFLLSMQVPAGKPQAGMAHHKMHDVAWTGLPLLPADDAMARFLYPPSTAATLNLAATGAQCARVFARFDRALAQRCLAAARTAWAAALANPAIYAPPPPSEGGGTYDDTNVTDEFYWAAAELYITTGEKQYKDFVLASPLHTSDVFRADGFDWGYTATLGRIDLALLPNHLPGRNAVRASVLAGADKYLATLKAHPYGVPYAPTGNMFAWGSNNLVLNNMVVMAVAHDLSGQEKYRDGVFQGIDYILGRNALNISYVTGYGDVASNNQHSRWYSAMLDASLPHPPAGSLAGGPNSSIQDPVAQQLLQNCQPQFCYIDHIGSWSTNELTINWNSTLAWNAYWIADEA